MTRSSIRLRLSQSDVRMFAAHGFVEESIVFGPNPNEALCYRLERTDGADRLAAKLADARITVFIPAAAADRWTASNEVGIGSDADSEPAGRLDILIEKDFACLTSRPGDDDADTFPNPAAVEANC